MPPKGAKRPGSDNISVGKRLRRNISEAKPLEGEVVIVLVGSGRCKKTYVVDKDTLTSHSVFFTEGPDRGKRGTGASVVSLPDEIPEIFNIFRHFVTTGQVFSTHDDDYEIALPGEGDGTDKEWARLIDAWVLGEHLQSCSFKDVIVDTIIDKVIKDDCFCPAIQEDIYPESKKRSAIRKLVVDMIIWNHDQESLARLTYAKDMSRFYYDLALAQMSYTALGKPGRAPYAGRDTCRYHEHGQNGKCYKAMF